MLDQALQQVGRLLGSKPLPEPLPASAPASDAAIRLMPGHHDHQHISKRADGPYAAADLAFGVANSLGTIMFAYGKRQGPW